ncbi:hypothetical protein F5X97DRAFT_324694 [Nemania serpens]|nr:hypothetical protein F5X97DRAFT_324694 [Nemania serpens]
MRDDARIYIQDDAQTYMQDNAHMPEMYSPIEGFHVEPMHDQEMHPDSIDGFNVESVHDQEMYSNEFPIDGFHVKPVHDQEIPPASIDGFNLESVHDPEMYSNAFPIDGLHVDPVHHQAPPCDISFEYMGGGDGMAYDDFPAEFYSIPEDESVQFILDNNMAQADGMNYSSEPVNEALRAMTLGEFWTPEIEAALRAEIDAVCEAMRDEAENDGTINGSYDSEASFMDLLEADRDSSG